MITDMRGNGDDKTCPTLTKEAAGDRPSDYAPMVFDALNNKAAEKSTALGTNCGMATGRSLAFVQSQTGQLREEPIAPTVGTNSNASGRNTPAVRSGMSVRRLMPVEVERLQGFPDDHTKVPWRGKPASECPDGPRYKAVGNSWAVPCARWIGERIEMVEKQGRA